MMEHLTRKFSRELPNGFSAKGNLIRCLAHIVHLIALEILKVIKSNVKETANGGMELEDELEYGPDEEVDPEGDGWSGGNFSTGMF